MSPILLFKVGQINRITREYKHSMEKKKQQQQMLSEVQLHIVHKVFEFLHHY